MTNVMIHIMLSIFLTITMIAAQQNSKCLSGYTFCANEFGTCSFKGTVAYGAYGKGWKYKTSSGSIGCNNGVYGDPAPGTAKSCCKKSSTNTGPSPTKKPTKKPTSSNTGGNGGGYTIGQGGPTKYNFIDPNPSCLDVRNGKICPQSKRNQFNAIYPNQGERVWYTTRNFARMWPDTYRKHRIGMKRYGTFGPDLVYPNHDYCGKQAFHPLYFQSEAAQVCRFKTWDECNPGAGHNTCPNRCSLFTQTKCADNLCGYSNRACNYIPDSMRQGANGYGIGGEGLWGANDGYMSGGHCSAVFNPDQWYMGIGREPKQNGGCQININGGPPISYPLVAGAHFDQNFNVPDFTRKSGKDLEFLVYYWSKTKKANVYLLYDGKITTMTRGGGNQKSGFYEAFFSMPSRCKPYAFFAVTENKEIYRLPEDEKYFFGLSWWIPPDSWKQTRPFQCTESHYYNRNGWRYNAGPNNWGSTSNCKGCQDIPALVTAYNNFKNGGSSGGNTGGGNTGGGGGKCCGVCQKAQNKKGNQFGCDNTCVTEVCGKDNYCCNTRWDSICANIAKTKSNGCSGAFLDLGAIVEEERVIEDDGSLTTTGVIAIVCGVVVCVAAVIMIGLFIMYKKKKNKGTEYKKEDQMAIVEEDEMAQTGKGTTDMAEEIEIDVDIEENVENETMIDPEAEDDQ